MEAGEKSIPVTRQPLLASSTAYSPGPHVTSSTWAPGIKANFDQSQLICCRRSAGCREAAPCDSSRCSRSILSENPGSSQGKFPPSDQGVGRSGRRYIRHRAWTNFSRVSFIARNYTRLTEPVFPSMKDWNLKNAEISSVSGCPMTFLKNQAINT